MRKRWKQLFRATDFQGLMYPCFTFCRILGIFPYKINNSIFEFSKPHYIVSILTICILCVFELITLYWCNKITNFEDVIMFFEANCYKILSGFIAITTLILSSPRMRLLQTIMEISSRLPPKSFQKLSRLIHFKDIFGFFYPIVGLILTDLFIIKIDIFYLIFSEYTALLVFQMDMLYMNCVCILKACSKEINNDLQHMQELVNSGPCISMMFYYEQRNLHLIMNLKALKKQHLTINNTVQMLNMIFNLQLLATTGMTFFEIIFALYFYVIKWDSGLFINWGKNMSFFLTSAIYHIIRILLLVWACETGKNEAQKIRTIIHDILNNTRDERIKNELYLFSLQILHCKSTFSAKGFTMDATLFTMMASTVTTYMLILLQFLIISHTC